MALDFLGLGYPLRILLGETVRPGSYWLLIVMRGRPIVKNSVASCEFSCVRGDPFTPMPIRRPWLSSVGHKPKLKDKSTRVLDGRGKGTLAGMGGR